MSTIILVATALTCLGLAEAVYYAIRYSGERKRSDLRRRLQALSGESTASLLRERRVAKNEELERLLQLFPFTAPLERLLLQTDLSWTVASMLGLGVVFAGFFTGAFSLLMRGSLSLTWIAVPLGFAMPVFIAMSARSRRSALLSSQLPEALDMMVRSLRAGHGVNSSFKLVATEMPTPIAVEFARCFEEINVGSEFREAVENLTLRVPGNLDLKIFAVSVVLQHETGGNLVEVLEQISHTIRERYKFYGKVAALTAEGKISGIILGALPFVTAALIASGNPKYMGVLVTDPLGRYFILGALFLWVVGVLWIAKLTKVEY